MHTVKRIIGEEEHTGLFQYFIRVIPTIYTNEYGHQVKTNQYTITDRFRPLNMPANGAAPNAKVLRFELLLRIDLGVCCLICPSFIIFYLLHSIDRSYFVSCCFLSYLSNSPRRPSCRAFSSCTSCLLS